VYFHIDVSIPHRYGKNSIENLFAMALPWKVSIPHRYGKNRKLGRGGILRFRTFPFLIGTVRTHGITVSGGDDITCFHSS